MYKWPQGRVTRTIAFVVLLVIAADLTLVGGLPNLRVWLDADRQSWRTLATAAIYFALGAGIILAGLVAVGFKARTVDFLIDVEQEMTRVTWPTTNDLVRATIVIAVMIAILAAVIIAVDSFNIHVLFRALYGERQ